MKQQTTWVLQNRGTGLVAGLSWQYLPLRGRRNMRLRAKEARASHWTELVTNKSQSPGTLLGTVVITDTSSLKLRLASMALAVLPALPRFCYAVFALSKDKYWFIAVSDGMLSPLSDIVGDESVIRTAVTHFLQILVRPAEGWTIYAPDDFFPDQQTENKSLTDLIYNKTRLRRARLHKTHNPQLLWYWGLSVIAVIGGYLLLNAWQQHQKVTRVIAAQAALRARQQASNAALTDNQKPWAKQPRLPEMLDTCRAVWKAAPVSVAGWIFNSATCNTSGKIILHYALTGGGTVSDFAARIPVIYPPDIQPVFNIPGGADDAIITLPVKLIPPEHPETLLPGDQQIQQLTSYAQRLNARLRLSAQDNPTRLTKGSVQPLPWRTFSFTFITDIPPDRLFGSSRFNSNGIRANSIAATLKNNRLEYTIDGVLYVK